MFNQKNFPKRIFSSQMSNPSQYQSQIQTHSQFQNSFPENNYFNPSQEMYCCDNRSIYSASTTSSSQNPNMINFKKKVILILNRI